MDRSFLSDAAVIAASRQFVCVRLATYEDPAEAKFLKAICPTKSGELENTVFVILGPDGQKQLTPARRGPKGIFQNAQHLAKTMNGIAQEHAGKPTNQPLPLVANVRLAVDVAACDNQPLIVVCCGDAAARQALHDQLAALAWSEAFVGKFVFAAVAAPKELTALTGVETKAGLIAIQPDQFGQSGKVLTQVGPNVSKTELAKFLNDAASQYQPYQKSFSTHVYQGKKLGVFWETVIPVSDPMEAMARKKPKASKQ